MNYREDIQGLRGLAVIFVFIFHLSLNYLPGGFIGVDMFFVISGFLISKIIFNKINNNNFSLFNFYEGRIKRIVPAYFFMIICVWVAFQFIFTYSEVSKFRSLQFWTTIFWSNFHFPKVDDYFGASSTENPFLHSWTLSVEMQFYFILPILLLLIRRIRPLLITIIICAIILFLYSSFQIQDGNKVKMYFSLLSRTPEFLIGVIFGLSKLEDVNFIKRNHSIISIIGLFLLIVSLIFINEESHFPGLMSVIPCLGTAFILITPSSKLNNLLSLKPLVSIGEISYSIYLWHWPVMAFLRYYNQRYYFNLIESFYVIIITIALSLFSYYLIERNLRIRSGLKFYLPFSILVIVNILMIMIIKPVKYTITPVANGFGFPTFGINSHGNKFKQVETFGDSSVTTSEIVLLGDSHALTLKPFLHVLGKKNGFSYRTITNDSYPVIPGLNDSLFIDSKKLTQYKFLESKAIDEIKNAKLILIMFSKDGARWAPAVKSLSESLYNDQKLLIISDYPYLDKNPSRFHSINKADFKNIKFNVKYPKLDSTILNLISEKENIIHVNLHKCDSFFKDTPFINDTLMYYDATHINEYGIRKYEIQAGDLFMNYLKPLLTK